RSVQPLNRKRRFSVEVEIMYSIEQRVFLVLEYHRLERSPTATRHSFQKRFNVPKGPDAKTIRKLFAKFERTGSVDDKRVEMLEPGKL
ncbi:hypothetical protein AVEN_78328-1, partial [Araneus ventricosus]